MLDELKSYPEGEVPDFLAWKSELVCDSSLSCFSFFSFSLVDALSMFIFIKDIILYSPRI